MGNRFFTMTGYHSLIKAHGIVAAITFLGIVPAAIFLMRFYGRQPRMALRLHIWLQILTLLLTTVVFSLGWFAVGPNRSLTNPHHGIGLAIFILVWVQFIGGWLTHRSEKNKRHYHIPFKAMLHHWLGRAVALLGIAQVALGLTLYGSPVALFVVYTLVVFALLVLYFVLEWLAEKRRGQYGSEGGSHYSEEIVEERANRQHGKAGKLAAAGAAGVGLAALWRRRSSRNRSHADVVGTESATSYDYDEKYSDTSNKGLGHRILQIGAIGGGLAALKKLFDRRNGRDDSSETGPYRPPLGGNQSVTTDSMSRIEEGRPPPRPVTPTGNSPGYIRPTHPLAQPPMTPGSGRRHSTSDLSYGSYISGSPSRQDRRHHTFRDALAAGGATYAVRSLFKNRQQRKEERRAEELRTQRLEEERVARMNSVHRYTGDGVTPPKRPRQNRMGSQSASDYSSILEGGPSRPGMSSALPRAGAGTAALGTLPDRNRIRPTGIDPVLSQQPIAGPIAPPADIPPIPPPHVVDPQSSGSEMYTTTSVRPRHRHHLRDDAATGLGGAAVGAAAAERHSRRRHSARNTDSVESQPVSLKVKMHNDGRHVTLRRLTEEEAAAQRAARRAERRAGRNSSLSSSSGGETLGAGTAADRRWRRTEALERQQEAQNQAAAAHMAPPMPLPAPTASISPFPTPPPPGTQQPVTQTMDPRTGQILNVPPPPPIPASASNLGPAGSITSPGTETSGATEYANNRRRRRAERAQARLAREGRAGGNTVEFS